MKTTPINLCLEAVRAAMPGLREPVVAVLGSGWRDVTRGFRRLATIEYGDLPGLGATQVAGHTGQLVRAECEGGDVLVFVGRRHWYEGAGWGPISMPVALARELGAKTIILTNSAGGVREGLLPGTLMVIDDHINAMGVNPLIGPHEAAWGLRFPDMSHVYAPELRNRLDEAARRAAVPVMHGIYLAVSGPSYETPAEIRAFQKLGADAVGMSTVPEAILAHAAGLRVAGLSCITNAAAGLTQSLSHRDVLERAAAAIPAMTAVLREFVKLTLKEKKT